MMPVGRISLVCCCLKLKCFSGTPQKIKSQRIHRRSSLTDTVTEMSVRIPEYRLLPLWLSAPQTSMDGLVSALWSRIFPERRSFGPNHKLDRVFAQMHQQPGLAALQICPLYFDQVTCDLPTATRGERYNLGLRCFDSWANLRAGKERAVAQRLHHGAYEDYRPNAGLYLSKLCKLHDPHTGGSINNKKFLFLMYGYKD